MVDLCVEVGLQLWKVFTEQGVLEFLETNVKVLYAANPIKTGLLLLEILAKLRGRFLNLKLELSEAIRKTNALLKDVIKAINRDTIRKMILEDTDMRGRTVLSLLKPHLELIVLIEDFIQARFRFGKDGGISLRKAPFAQHSVYHEICTTQSLQKGLTMWNSRKNKGASLSMFFLFRRSIMAKYFHHWLFTIMIVIYNQIHINRIVGLLLDIRNTYEIQKTDPLLPNTTPLFNDAYSQFQNFADILSILLILVSLTVFSDLSLLSMSKKPCKLQFGHLLTLISFSTLVYSISGLQIYLKDFENKEFASHASRIIDFKDYMTEYEGRAYIEVLSGAFFTNWLYALFAIRVFEFLGILVVIISKMVMRLIPFLVLQFSVIFIFSMSAIISFYVNETYREVKDTMITLFSALLGQFDFSTQADGSTDSILFLLAFLIINTIILLNLLIALLLQDYNEVKTNSKGYFLQQVLSLEPLWQQDQNFGSLTFKQGPLIVLNLIFVPFLYLKLKLLNRILEIILFIPSMLLSIVVFLCFEIFYFLYSYLFIFAPIFNSPSHKSGPCTRLCKGVGLFLIYPLLFVPTLFRDVVVFTINVFASEKEFQVSSSAIYTPPVITQQELNLLVCTLRAILKNKTRLEAELLFVTTKDVVRQMRGETCLNLTINGLYSSVLKDPYEIRNVQAQKFDSYERMKLFLWQNSFLYKDVRVVYPKGLLQALLSLEMIQSEIQKPEIKKGKGKYELNQSFNTFNNLGSQSSDDLTPSIRIPNQCNIKGLGYVINGRMGRTKLQEGRFRILKLKDQVPALLREADRANFWK